MKTKSAKMLFRVLGIALSPFAILFVLLGIKSKSQHPDIPFLLLGLFMTCSSLSLLFGACHLARALSKRPPDGESHGQQQRVRKLTIAAAAVATPITAAILIRFNTPLLEDATPFKDATNIVFTEPEELPTPGSPKPERKQFTVSASNEVSRLLSLVRLQPKPPCPCQPHYEALFLKPAGEIRVSFCDHCFDVFDGKTGEPHQGVRFYRMPGNFFGEFRRIAHDREKWPVREP